VVDGGTRMSREVTVTAVEAMNEQGGLPWLTWANTTSLPVIKRVKARGTRIWRLAEGGGKTLVALAARDKESLSKERRKIAGRVLELTWVTSSEIE
ncbi:MAG TPA: hypothetical protein PK095_08220, partial [Myxococcota bacterium]|nr:hypothetical protein [Myxococcota bacterium]